MIFRDVFFLALCMMLPANASSNHTPSSAAYSRYQSVIYTLGYNIETGKSNAYVLWFDDISLKRCPENTNWK